MIARLLVDTSGDDAALAQLRGINVAIDRTVNSAMGKATRSATAAVKKGYARELGATAGAVNKKKRINSRIMRASGLIWIGLDPLLPTHLGGNVSQTATGVTAGNHSFVGAFHKAIYTQDKKVWIRLHSRHYDADLYPYKGRGSSGGGHGKRFPVVLGRVKVDTDAIRNMINHEADQAGELLADLVAQELGIAIGDKA